MITDKFHVNLRNPGKLQSVKTVTANVPEIRKVTTAFQDQKAKENVEFIFY